MSGDIAPLRRALCRLRQEAPEEFALLFAPDAQRRPVALPPGLAGVAALVCAAGLAVEEERGLRGLRRIRTLGERCYVMDSGEAGEYYQDVWPETDALLALLEGAAPGRLLDVGTGTGIVAIEAAARGHEVVATDLYESALSVARFNAALSGVSIDFRRGHLFDLVAGERFDLVLTAPHYGRVADQLRAEALRAAPRHLRPGGTLALATVLEWERPGVYPLVETVLRPHAAAGCTVRVAPIRSPYKTWFSAARAEGVDERLVSRHRFLITIIAPQENVDVDVDADADADADVTDPDPAETPVQIHVPSTASPNPPPRPTP